MTAPLAEIVQRHIEKATVDLRLLARHVPIEERAEHLHDDGAPRMVDGLDGVPQARYDAHLAALEGLESIEQRNVELDAARDVIIAEQARTRAAMSEWRRNNMHLFEQHGQHSYLGLDDPDALQAQLHERDAEIAALRAQLDEKG